MLSLSVQSLDGSIFSFDVWEVAEFPLYRDENGNLYRIIDDFVYTLFSGRWLKSGRFVEVVA